MLDEPIDVVRQMFDRPARLRDPNVGELDLLDSEVRNAVFEYLDRDVELYEDPRFLEGGLHRGLDAVRAYFEQFTGNFDEYVAYAPEYTPVDDERVLAEFHFRMRGKESGAPIEIQPGWIYTVRNGKVVRIEAYIDRAEARAAID